MSYWVYILASRRGGTLYVGVTNDLVRQIYEHREGLVPGFTRRYGVKRPVYYDHSMIRPQRFNERKTSSTGRASGRLI